MKKGYTLVEMMVVMTIIAVLSSLGVGALITTRNNSEVDKAAEEILTLIRQAQNNAIAIKQDSAADPTSHVTKAWTARIFSDTYTDVPANKNKVQLISLFYDGTKNGLEECAVADCPESELKSFDNVEITITSTVATENYKYINAAFSAPFASPNILLSRTCTGGPSVLNDTGIGCHWTENIIKPTKEWFLEKNSVAVSDIDNRILNTSNKPTDSVVITIKKPGSAYSRTVKVMGNGDAKIE